MTDDIISDISVLVIMLSKAFFTINALDKPGHYITQNKYNTIKIGKYTPKYIFSEVILLFEIIRDVFTMYVDCFYGPW